MQRRTLGRTGLEVSVLGLGGVFVSSLGSDRSAGRQTIQRALELGVNYIDTARSYADSEEVIGEALQRAAPTVPPYISTKVGGWPDPFDPRDKNALRQSFGASLKALRADSVAGLLVHEPDRPGLFDWWTDDEAAEGTVTELLDELKHEGKIRFSGLGGTTAYELGRKVSTGRFDVVMTAFNYSLLWREAVHSVLPAARAQNVGIVVGAPLQQGALARRYDEELSTARWISPPRRDQFQALYALADDIRMELPELGLRFVISNPHVSCVVVGARSIGEIENSVEAAEKGALPEDVMAELDRIAAMVPFRPFEEPGGPFGLPFGRIYKGPGPLLGTSAVGGIDKSSKS